MRFINKSNILDHEMSSSDACKYFIVIYVCPISPPIFVSELYTKIVVFCVLGSPQFYGVFFLSHARFTPYTTQGLKTNVQNQCIEEKNLSNW